MNVQRWIARRERSWRQLDQLLKQAEGRGLRSLKAEEIQALASLYRSVSADLARARTQQVSTVIVQNLQSLTARSYTQIYQGSRHQEWRAVWQFYRWGFPAVVQQSRGAIALAITLFIAATSVSWWFAWQDPTFLELIVPPDLIEQVRDRQELWTGNIVGIEPFASTSIMVNNIQVSFTAVVGGIPAGLLTLYVVLLNGILIGAIGALVGQNHLAYPFWAFVFPHGALELPAIFLAAGAGFLLAKAVLFPGRYRRLDALRQQGQQAAQLVFGIVPLLVIAGIIEGFISPSPVIPDWINYVVGVILFIGLITYLRQRPPEVL